MRPRQRFANEFKTEAVQLFETGLRPAPEITREPGIRRNQLYKWQEQVAIHFCSGAFPGSGRRPGTFDKLAQVTRVLERATE